MKFLILFLPLILLMSCGNGDENRSSRQEKDLQDDSDTISAASFSGRNFSSDQWNFEVEYPRHFEIDESILPAETPVVNIYDTTNVKSPPYAIHEDASLSYIALLPVSYGVDAPAGKQVSYGNWKNDLALSFEVDEEKSMVYLLESDQAWAYSFRLKNPSQGWNEYATVFVNVKVDNFKTQCFDRSSGEEKTMADCTPMGGEDEVRYYGELDTSSEEDLIGILQNLEFR